MSRFSRLIGGGKFVQAVEATWTRAGRERHEGRTRVGLGEDKTRPAVSGKASRDPGAGPHRRRIRLYMPRPHFFRQKTAGKLREAGSSPLAAFPCADTSLNEW